MKQTTLSFLVKEGEVLLAMKKRGFGAGKWNGAGGKVNKGENVEVSAVREIREEIGVSVALKDLNNVGTLNFHFDENPDWDQTCEVFIIHKWTGEPSESEEMRPRWYPIQTLPFDEMWVDDPHWLPNVLGGKKIEGEFLFDRSGGTMLEYKVREVPSV